MAGNLTAEKGTIERYDFADCCDQPGMILSKDGSFVRYSDHLAAVKALSNFEHGPAARRVIDFLLGVYENRPCDSEGVVDCVRCNTVSAARWLLSVLDSRANDGVMSHE